MSWKKFGTYTGDGWFVSTNNSTGDTTDVWIEYIVPTNRTDQSSYVVLPKDWLKHGDFKELPVELPDDLPIQLEPGKCFKWRILRKVLLRHLDEVKDLELVDLFYNPRADDKADEEDLEEGEDGMES